ncbi:hypothetical protein [Bacillus massiliglaciei]|uniref:hypothetical protein n=1 Tax=Bacillus massiliglaciei TaxID=1816693 RepID=UPI000AA9CF75|nr:hypothetical protein [Bacillus massiliglaciei]
MRKLWMLTFAAVVMTGCGNHDEAEQTQPSQQTADEMKTDTGQKEAASETSAEGRENSTKESDFNSEISNDWNVTLPINFPVSEGKFLTAVTSKEQDEITFDFYETDKKLEINDSAIKDSGQYVGQLAVTNYETEEMASEQIDQTKFSQGEKVDLGHGITGYQDAGAGSQFTSWNEGRWALVARSTTEKSEESAATAKETVDYLETHSLPIPKPYGQLHMDAEGDSSLAKWQKQNIVYTMTDFGDQTLDWLVTFK